MKKVLLEALLVAVAGAVVAFAANALSSRGIHLTKNYFPGATRVSVADAARHSSGSGGTNVSNPADVAEQLRKKGLQVVDGKQASELFRDPRFQQGLIIFVDARNDEHYQEGHIPGAYQFSHFHPENYLATVLPACNVAQQIVVYCTGGSCDESEFAALSLRDDAKVPGDKLWVYVGGITEWKQNGLPIEKGERNSGQIIAASK